MSLCQARDRQWDGRVTPNCIEGLALLDSVPGMKLCAEESPWDRVVRQGG